MEGSLENVVKMEHEMTESVCMERDCNAWLVKEPKETVSSDFLKQPKQEVTTWLIPQDKEDEDTKLCTDPIKKEGYAASILEPKVEVTTGLSLQYDEEITGPLKEEKCTEFFEDDPVNNDDADITHSSLSCLSRLHAKSQLLDFKHTPILSPEDAVKYLQERGVLHKEKFCKNGHAMRLVQSRLDLLWRCSKRECRTKLGLRTGTWLQGSKLPLQTIVQFIHAWTERLTTTTFCSVQLRMASEAATDWKNYLREVCANSLIRHSIKIGGEGLSVELSDSSFSRKKSNASRVCSEQWVLGGICRETNKCFVCAVPDRSADTLLATVQEYVLPGTKIITDKCPVYNGISSLSDMRYQHFTVDPSKYFKDPITHEDTSDVESLWSFTKHRNKSERGTRRPLVDSYMCEYLWRKLHHDKDFLTQIYEDIAAFYPLDQ